MAYDTNEPDAFRVVTSPPGSGPDDLTRALRGELTDREKSMIGYSPETKKVIERAISLDPALEETILLIAELAYGDGQGGI